MKFKRTDRLNSLIKEVLSEVITRDVNDPNISQFTTVTSVEVTPDLHQAKVYISVIGTEKERSDTIAALQNSAGFIGKTASKKIVIRYFPSLTFYLDTSVDKRMKIEKVLQEIEEKKKTK